MRILVTGASGLLGLNIGLDAARRHTVVGLVHRHTLRDPGFQVVQADLLAPGAVERLLDEAQPDWVIHCAALADLEACEADPVRARQLNTELPGKLAQHVARGGARLVHVSTDAVFDGQKGDYRETDPPNPLSIYAQSKLAGEQAVARANPQAIIARVNLFGWSLKGQRSLAEFFYYNLSAGRHIKGFTDVYFCPLLANHLAGIFLQMLERNLSGLYHVVSRECASKYAFGRQLARKFGLDESLIAPISVAEAGLKAARSPNLTLNTGKLTTALGAPPPDLSTGIHGFYQLYQQGYPQFLQGLASQD